MIIPPYFPLIEQTKADLNVLFHNKEFMSNLLLWFPVSRRTSSHFLLRDIFQFNLEMYEMTHFCFVYCVFFKYICYFHKFYSEKKNEYLLTFNIEKAIPLLPLLA